MHRNNTICIVLIQGFTAHINWRGLVFTISQLAVEASAGNTEQARRLRNMALGVGHGVLDGPVPGHVLRKQMLGRTKKVLEITPVHGKELKRWEALFERSLAQRHALLTAAEITQLRESMDLNKKDFARLLGVSLRSIHIWEKQGRQSVSSRGADLLMKLVAASLREGKVDVISLLLEEAKKWGMELEVRHTVVDEAAA